MKLIRHEQVAVAAVWAEILGWDRERITAEFNSQRWTDLLEHGHQVYWRDGEDHPCLHLFSHDNGIEVCTLDDLKRHTPFADEAS